MIVPKYWAEGCCRHRERHRQFTVRRWGWSDNSQEEAQAHADARAQSALQQLLAGEALVRREPLRPYNGAEGVPIREEIVGRFGDTILTRNSYGALCLNTPNVLFADIDFEDAPSCGLILTLYVLLAGSGCGAAWQWHSKGLAMASLVASMFLSYWLAHLCHRLLALVRGSPEAIARRRIEQFVDDHRDWHLRIYRTPAGLRILVMHRTFEPDDAEVDECFRAFAADPLYVRMCRNQRCFRARVSPKPWRIGISAHLMPRRGRWPVPPELVDRRRQWVEAYERAAQPYAACNFLEDLGSSTVNDSARNVQLLHDELCRAQAALPLA